MSTITSYYYIIVYIYNNVNLMYLMSFLIPDNCSNVGNPAKYTRKFKKTLHRRKIWKMRSSFKNSINKIFTYFFIFAHMLLLYLFVYDYKTP